MPLPEQSLIKKKKKYLQETEKEIKGINQNSQSLSEMSVTAAVTADRSPWQHVCSFTKLLITALATHTRWPPAALSPTHLSNKQTVKGCTNMMWETWCHGDRCGTSWAAEITIKVAHHLDSDLCYDPHSQVSSYKLLSVNWHQRRGKRRIGGREVGGGFSYNCLVRNGFYCRKLVKKKSNLKSALSSSHLVPKSFSFVLTLNPDLKAELDQKIHVFKQCHKYKNAISTWSESENCDTDQRWNLILSLAAFFWRVLSRLLWFQNKCGDERHTAVPSGVLE